MSTKSNLIRHKHLAHELDKKVNCNACDSSFNDKFQLKKHFLRMHEKSKNVKCVSCDKQFFDRGSLNTHVSRVHEKRKGIECPICHSIISHIYDLKELGMLRVITRPVRPDP